MPGKKPNPGDYQDQGSWMKVCMPHMMEESGYPQDRAVAACLSMWRGGKSADDPSLIQRAFSLLTVKSIDDQRRIITGIASTPTVDRVGDIVDPMGAQFSLPHPLLLYHNAEKPVGSVDFAKPTKEGIPFSASIPEVKEPGVVQDRVNEALHSLKYKLLGAVSIGFVPVEGGVEILKSGGFFYKVWRWLETTLCSIPANPEATVLSFKSMDSAKIRAALSIAPERRGVVRLDEATINRAKFGDKPGVVYLKK